MKRDKVPVLTKEQNRDLLLTVLQSLADERERLGIKPSGDPLRDLCDNLTGVLGYLRAGSRSARLGT